MFKITARDEMKREDEAKGAKYPSISLLRITKKSSDSYSQMISTGTLVKHPEFRQKFILTTAESLINAVKVEAAIGCNFYSRFTRFVELTDWAPNENYSIGHDSYNIALIMLNPWQCIRNNAINVVDNDFTSGNDFRCVYWNNPNDRRKEAQLNEALITKLSPKEDVPDANLVENAYLFYGGDCKGKYVEVESGASLIQYDPDWLPVLFAIASRKAVNQSDEITPYCSFVKVQPHLPWIESKLQMFATKFPYCSTTNMFKRFKHNI